MKRVFVVLLLLIPLAAALAGCQRSEPVSKVYSSSYDKTWNAAVLAAKDLTGDTPPEANRSTGRIRTRWTRGAVSEQPLDPGRKVTDTLVRGFITIQQHGTGTLVSVRIEQQQVEEITETPDPNAHETNWKVIVRPQGTGWGNVFLNEMDQQLRNKK